MSVRVVTRATLSADGVVSEHWRTRTPRAGGYARCDGGWQASRAMAGLRSVAATRYVTPLREGGSLPGLVEADDDGLYVLKFRGAGQGIKALVAEVIAGELARALGLAVPEIVLMEVDPALGRGGAGSGDPGPDHGVGGGQRRAGLPPGIAAVHARRGLPADAGAGGGGGVARRAGLERRPHAAQPEPARLARAAVADRPRRGAVLPPPRLVARGGRAEAVRGHLRPRAAADRRLRSPRPTSGSRRALAGARARRRSRPCPPDWIDAERYVDYLTRRLAAPRGWVP